MAQISTDLYASIAEYFANAYDYLQLVPGEIQNALYSVVDVTTGGYSEGESAAVEITLALVSPINSAYNSSVNIAGSSNGLLDAIRAINNHVINNSSVSGTSSYKLTYWVNETMEVETNWEHGVPTGWYNLSLLAGYDVSDWRLNPSA